MQSYLANWQIGKDSNPQHTDLEAAVLPVELPTYKLVDVDGFEPPRFLQN